MRTSRFAMFVAPLALALVAVPALAHGPGGEGACRQEIEAICSAATGSGDCVSKLCGPTFPSGPGALANCILSLTPPPKGLSPTCLTNLKNMQAKIAAWQTSFQNACGTATSGDVSTYCGNVTGGTESTIKCLRQAVTDNKPVSKDCQALLAQHHGHRHHEHP